MPQVKKQDVKQRILDAAYSEFFDKGFEKASIRSIVKKAKTNIGNFYNYYESKEQVFEDLVLNVYNNIIFFIENHNDDYELDVQKFFENKAIIKHLLDEAAVLFDKNFVLLIEKSSGTKFENAKSKIIEVLSEHFFEHMKAFKSDYKHTEMSHIIAKQFLCGLIEILKTDYDEDTKKDLIVEQLIYTSYGTLSLLDRSKS